MRASRFLPVLATAGLLVAACGGTSDGDTAVTVDEQVTTAESPDTAASEAPETPTPAADSSAVPAALQFSAPLVGGGEIDATTLAGKPTLFWFWAPT